MKDLVAKIVQNIKIKTPGRFSRFTPFNTFAKEVGYSVDKYGNTYKLLEKHDQASEDHADLLADPEGLRDYLLSVQSGDRVQRTDSSL